MSDPLAALLDVVDLLAAVVGDDVLGREVVVDVDAELALAGVLGQVADMAVGGEDAVVVAEIALDRPRLGRRLDDHEVLRHGRECSTGSFAHPYLARERPADAPRTRSEGRVQTSRMRRRKSSSISSSPSSAASAASVLARHARPRRAPARRRPARRASAACGGISRNDDAVVREEEDRLHVVDEDRPLAVDRRAGSCSARRRRRLGSSNRSARSGCSLARCRTALRIMARIVRRAVVRTGLARWSPYGW